VSAGRLDGRRARRGSCGKIVAMVRSLILVMVSVVALGHVARADTGDDKSPALAILQRAIDQEKEAGALDQALKELDELATARPRDPDLHYARGWVLSHSGQAAPAVVAYDKAFSLDKTLAAAAYNAGVVLATSGKPKEAAIRFDRALAADPKNVDAAYNAGQSYYDLKNFAKAAQRWSAAAVLTPDDFSVAKKLVQAYVALGQKAKAAKARDKVFALWRAATDPALKNMKSYVYDQFDVGSHHIFVYEAFDTSGDLAYVYEFRVTGGDKVLGSVNLETSAVIREQGVPFILGMDKDGSHQSFSDRTWKTLPAYKDIKAAATKVIKAQF